MKKLFLLFALNLLFVQQGFSQTRWEKLNPTVADYLQKVFMINDTTAIVVGSTGTILRSTDAGTTWNKIPSPVTSDLMDVYFPNETEGWIAAVNSILHTQDGGFTWTVAYTTSSSVLSIFFLDQFYGWAGGSYGEIWKTTNGGITWISTGSQTKYSWIFDIQFVDHSNGYAVGSNFGFFKTTDGGTTWNVSEGNDGFSTLLKALYFTDAKTGWVAGKDGYVNFTSDGGVTWTGMGNLTPEALNYQVMHSIAYTGARIVVVGNQGYYAYSDNGGTSWAIQQIQDSQNIYSVSFADGPHGIAVGFGGQIVASDDYGTTWAKRTTTAMSENLYSVFFSDTLHGWVVGDHGLYSETTDGGFSWQNYQAPTPYMMGDVFFLGNNGWICGDGGLVLRTTDNGKSWATSLTPDQITLVAIRFLDSLKGITLGGTGYGKIFKTTDGGATWREIIREIPLYSLCTRNPNKLFIGGYGGLLLYSVDEGESWAQIQSSITESIKNIQFVNDNTGFIITTTGLFKSTDAGENWTPITLPNGLEVQGSYFLDEKTGWVFGREGKIYLTQNGGGSWSQEPDLTIATINKMTFVGDKDGWAVGNFGTILRVRSEIKVDVKKEGKEIPSRFALHQNFPNPFNPATTIKYSIPAGNHRVTLAVYNSLGQQLTTLINKVQNGGNYSIKFNAEKLPSGIYFYRLQAGNFTETRKMILLK